jgi:hypothetical protein
MKDHLVATRWFLGKKGDHLVATKWSLSKKKKTFETLKIPHGGHNKVVSTLE